MPFATSLENDLQVNCHIVCLEKALDFSLGLGIRCCSK